MLDVILQAWKDAFAFSTSWSKHTLGQTIKSLPKDWDSDFACLWWIYAEGSLSLGRSCVFIFSSLMKAILSQRAVKPIAPQSSWRSSPCILIEPGKGRGCCYSQAHLRGVIDLAFIHIKSKFCKKKKISLSLLPKTKDLTDNSVCIEKNPDWCLLLFLLFSFFLSFIGFLGPHPRHM